MTKRAHRSTRKPKARLAPEDLEMLRAVAQVLNAQTARVQAEEAIRLQVHQQYLSVYRQVGEKYGLPERFNLDWKTGAVEPVEAM